MAALDQLRLLYEYNQWANGHILDAAAGLDAGDLDRDLGASFESVHGNLTHMLFAQRLWLSRWTGEPGPGHVDEKALEAVARELKESDAAVCAYADSLTENGLDRQLDYVDTQGNQQHATLWHTLLHVANHATHHRAEAAMLLTGLGKPPRQLDLAFFVLEKAGAPARLT